MIEYSKKTTHVDDDILMDELFQLGQHPRVEAAIIAFHKWVDKTRSVQSFAHCSVRTEWSLNSEMDGVWVHHHVTQSSPITTSMGSSAVCSKFRKMDVQEQDVQLDLQCGSWATLVSGNDQIACILFVCKTRCEPTDF